MGANNDSSRWQAVMTQTGVCVCVCGGGGLKADSRWWAAMTQTGSRWEQQVTVDGEQS